MAGVDNITSQLTVSSEKVDNAAFIVINHVQELTDNIIELKNDLKGKT